MEKLQEISNLPQINRKGELQTKLYLKKKKSKLNFFFHPYVIEERHKTVCFVLMLPCFLFFL